MSAPVARQIGGLKLVLMDPAGAGVVVPSSPQNAADMFAQHAEVQAAIEKNVNECGLQLHKTWVGKVIQLYETYQASRRPVAAQRRCGRVCG